MVYFVPGREELGVGMIPCGEKGNGALWWEKFRGRSRERFGQGMHVWLRDGRTRKRKNQSYRRVNGGERGHLWGHVEWV